MCVCLTVVAFFLFTHGFGSPVAGELGMDDFNDLETLLGEDGGEMRAPGALPLLPEIDSDGPAGADESSDSVAPPDDDDNDDDDNNEGDGSSATHGNVDAEVPASPPPPKLHVPSLPDESDILSLEAELARLGSASTNASPRHSKKDEEEAEQAEETEQPPRQAPSPGPASEPPLHKELPSTALVPALSVMSDCVPETVSVTRLSIAPPTEEAPPVPVAAATAGARKPVSQAPAKPKQPPPPAAGRSEVEAALRKELAQAKAELASLRDELEEANRKEFDVMERLQEALAKNEELTETAGRVQTLEMKLDAMERAAAAREDESQKKEQEEPTREELFAAVAAYRNQLEATVLDLKQSEERKNSLRDDLRKLIGKSKDLEESAQGWKARAEALEKKFEVTKELAKEYAVKAKSADRDRARKEELKEEVASLERRASKAEAMAKAAVACIKKSGTPEQKKELSAALQALQSQSGTAVARQQRGDESKVQQPQELKVHAANPSKLAAKLEQLKAETTAAADGNSSQNLSVKAGSSSKLMGGGSSTRIELKSPGLSVTPPRSPRSAAGGGTGITLTVGGEEVDSSLSSSTAPGKTVPYHMLKGEKGSVHSSPSPSRKMQHVAVASDTTALASPMVGRHGGNRNLQVVETESAVVSSPGIARKANPNARKASAPEIPKGGSSPNNVVADAARKLELQVQHQQQQQAAEKSPRNKHQQQHLAVASVSPATTSTIDAFDALEDVLSRVEQETGATGLTGEVDNSSVFDAGGGSGKAAASDYLAQMMHAAGEQEETRKRQAAEAKRELQRMQEEKRRDAKRAMLGKILAAEEKFEMAEMRLNQPTLSPLLSSDGSAVQTEEERNAILDAAVDSEHCGMEPALRVFVAGASDVGASEGSSVGIVASLKGQHRRCGANRPLAANRVVQWGESFVFPFSVQDADQRVTVTVLESGGDGGREKRVGLAQINLMELRGSGKEYYPIVDNSGGAPTIRGMITVAVSVHHRVIAKTPVKVVLDPQGREYQDAIRHNIAKIKKVEKNVYRERDGVLSYKNPVHAEMDKFDADLPFIASQIRCGAIDAGDKFENVYKRTLLHLMIILGDMELTDRCIAAGQDPKKRDCYGMLPFHLAIVHGHFQLLKNMLPLMKAFGQSVHTEEGQLGLSPVHLASIFKRPEILQWLLDLGAETDEKDEYGGLPIHKAAFVGSARCLEILVNKRAFVKAQDKDGNDPLLLAVMEGHWDCVDYLLTNPVSKADPETSNLRGDTCLWFAVTRANKRFTAQFLECQRAREVIGQGYGRHHMTLLMRALMELDSNGDEVVKMLASAMVQKGLGLNQLCIDGKSAAFFAAYRGKAALLAFLGSKGLVLDAEDENYNTALHFAANLQVAEILIQSGVDIDHKNKQRNTPLHAAYAFCPEVVDFLITTGANPKSKNRNDNVPLDVANVVGGRISVPGETAYVRGTGGLHIPKVDL